METNKIWVVCGDSDGVAAATVRYLLYRKEIVVALIKEQKAKRHTLDSIMFNGADVRYIDIFKPLDTKAAVRQIIHRYGRIDRLINIGNSGLLSMYVFDEMKEVGEGHIIQFLDSQQIIPTNNNMRINSTASEPIKEGESHHISYTLIEPAILFQ